MCLFEVQGGGFLTRMDRSTFIPWGRHEWTVKPFKARFELAILGTGELKRVTLQLPWLSPPQEVIIRYSYPRWQLIYDTLCWNTYQYYPGYFLSFLNRALEIKPATSRSEGISIYKWSIKPTLMAVSINVPPCDPECANEILSQSLQSCR